LKAVEPTRCPDTYIGTIDPLLPCPLVKKLLLLLALVGVGILAARKIRST